MTNEGKLTGKTILNIRPLAKALPLARVIEKEGGQCFVLPSIDIVPCISAPELEKFEGSHFWIFLSEYAVKYAFQKEWQFTTNKQRPQIVAIGQSTASALQQLGLHVDLMPTESSSEGLLALPQFQMLERKVVTIFRGEASRTLLDDTLKQRGAKVNEAIVYKRVVSEWTHKDYELLKNKIDLALGFSVDSLTYFFSKLELYSRQLNILKEECQALINRFLNIPWLVMSHRIAAEARKLGISTIYVVSDSDILSAIEFSVTNVYTGVKSINI